MAKDKIHEFTTHVSACEQCKTVDINRPATLVSCCLIGAPLLRDFLNFKASPEVRNLNRALKKQFTEDADGKTYRTTRAKLKEVMLFK